MSPRARRRGGSFEQARAELVARLRERQEEIEQAVLTRSFAVSEDPRAHTEPEYLEGMRAAVSAAVSYGIEVIELGERAQSPPPALLAQARLAARYGVGLDTVLRRYSAGYVLLSDFLVEEADRSGLRGADLQRLLRSQGGLDRLLATLSEEHARETQERPTSSEAQKAERIERLLGGELLETHDLKYDLAGHHLAILAKGREAMEVLRCLASALDRRLLTVRREEAVWAWLGGRRPFEMEELLRHARTAWPAGHALALGEPGETLAGWRLSHRQARAALPIALRGSEPIVRYADVALLTAVLKDELLAASLRRMYLEPLETERDGGKVARETLRAYFAAERNVSSAAMALGVQRHTVTNRLRAIEKRLGRPLGAWANEIETLLRMEGLDGPSTLVE